MICKFCQAELEEDVKICPACGAALEETEETPVEETVAEEIAAEETVTEQEETAEETEVPAEEIKEEKKPVKKVSWQTVVAIVASVVALVCLALVLLTAFGVDVFGKKEPVKEAEPLPAGDFVSEVDYTDTAKNAKKAAKTVVATMNGVELTNRELQVYYSMLVQDFVTNYYQYMEQLGLDITKDLNTQACYYDENLSWEAYFVDAAINTWKSRLAVTMLAEEDGYVLSDELQEALDKMPKELQAIAEEAGFKDVDELISNRVGGEATMKDYLEYSRLYYVGAEYTSILPSDEELSTYFDEMAEMFTEYGITKESGPIVDVRHILIQPKSDAESETESPTYSDEAWATCLKTAESVYKEWKEGEATEDSFADLARTYSDDPGSATNGGLYTEITSETAFVEPFLKWCMDEDRKVGDTDIVKTEHGYHIMYFSATEPQWLYYAKSQYVTDRTTEVMETGVEKWPAEIDKEKICLVAVDLS